MKDYALLYLSGSEENNEPEAFHLIPTNGLQNHQEARKHFEEAIEALYGGWTNGTAEVFFLEEMQPQITIKEAAQLFIKRNSDFYTFATTNAHGRKGDIYFNLFDFSNDKGGFWMGRGVSYVFEIENIKIGNAFNHPKIVFGFSKEGKVIEFNCSRFEMTEAQSYLAQFLKILYL